MVALSLSLSRFVMGRGRNEKGRNGREVLREEGEKRGKEKVACVRERRKKREKEKKNGKEKVIVQEGKRVRKEGKERRKRKRERTCVIG